MWSRWDFTAENRARWMRLRSEAEGREAEGWREELL